MNIWLRGFFFEVLWCFVVLWMVLWVIDNVNRCLNLISILIVVSVIMIYLIRLFWLIFLCKLGVWINRFKMVLFDGLIVVLIILFGFVLLRCEVVVCVLFLGWWMRKWSLEVFVL